MEWVSWLDKHPGAATALSNLLLVIVTVFYVIVTIKLWQATLNTARRTEELARQSRDAFKLHLVATYHRFMTSAAPFEVEQDSGPSVIRAQLRMLEILSEKAFPETWNELSELAQRKAHKNGP